MKQILPRNPADENHTILAWLRLFRAEGATHHRRHAQHSEKVGRDVESFLNSGMIAAGRDGEGCVLNERTRASWIVFACDRK